MGDEEDAVPTFRPQVQPIPLPQIGDAIERVVMDWKVKSANLSFEKAKDIAAFANHLGGCILIGVAEDKGQLVKYVGMPPNEAGKVRDDYSKAVVQRCQPPPNVDFEEYKDPHDSTKRIVAINIWPSLNLIGVKIDTDKSKEGFGGPAFVYPVRSGTDAMYLQPVQLPMYITAQVRRIAVMLARIPDGATVQLIETRLDNSKIDNAYTFDGVSEDENLVKFRVRGSSTVLHVPLDRVLTVYEGPDAAWRVVSQYFR
jgi:hypothetical protein